MSEAMTVIDQALDASVRFPGVRVNREKYLRASFGNVVSPEKIASAIESTPALAGIPAEAVERAANASINWHLAAVSTASAAAGVPGGLAIAASIPADMTQYFYHVLVISQKLAYLHGWPQLVNEDGELDDETRTLLMAFIGVMMGTEAAHQLVSKIANHLSNHIARELPKKALTKYALYNLAKSIAKMVGVKLNKDLFSKSIAKTIPFMGAGVSGVLTYTTYNQMTKRLKLHLETLPLATGSVS